MSDRRHLSHFEEERVRFVFKYLAKQELKVTEETLLLSFEKQFLKDGRLSDKQIEVIEDIFQRY